MGLDQYAYWREEEDNREDWEWDEDKEFSYWRKHYSLQSFMESLWKKKLNDRTEEDIFLDRLTNDEEKSFNCVELELTEEDLDNLERESELDRINYNSYKFTDESIDEESIDDSALFGSSFDKNFLENARKLLKEGKLVFYNSSW